AVYCASDSMDLSLNKLAMVVRAYGTWAERLGAWLDITKYHGNWEYINEEALAFWRNRVSDESKEWSNIAKVEPVSEPEARDEAEEPLFEHNEKALIELLEDCRKKNRQVLFLMTPYIYGEKITGRLKTLRKMVESYGYELLDFSRGSDIGLDYALDFYNTHHVNWRGAEKMTLALGDYIKKEYNIDAQHVQSVKDDWDAYAARNREESDKLTGDEDAGFDDSLEE
ncbi:MAG: hypothetical protein Q4G47_04320, partial [Lachnospiraceae bacterium]|nr:hypothetical protein [Lachnospiraceae bacterium]